MQINPKSLTVNQLLGAQSEQYIIPAYQRRYSWREKQLAELFDDIDLLSDTDTHLLGSIVCLTGPHTAGLNKLEVVDGQQRLTTLCILLHCLRTKLAGYDDGAGASEVDRLLQSRALNAKPSNKVRLDSLDAEEFKTRVADEPVEESQNHELERAFALFDEWFAQYSREELETYLYRLLNQTIVIRLEVADAKDAFKLFETINNRGLRLNSADIIKNFLLGNAARFGDRHLSEARKTWSNIIGHLDGVSFEAFFRHFLSARLKRRVTKSYVIAYFKNLFMTTVREASKLPERAHYLEESMGGGPDYDEDDSADEAGNGGASLEAAADADGEKTGFVQFLKDLSENAQVYGQLVRGDTGIPSIDRHLKNLQRISSAQTYAFLLHLRASGSSDKILVKVLKLTEAFLMRRHICRSRANENESVFASLCSVDIADPLPAIRKLYREYSPSDERFKEDFKSFAFTAGVLDRARYCLEQLEYQEHGTELELLVGGPDLVHVEHIVPQKIKTWGAKEEFGDWVKYLGDNSEERHSKYVSLIGNLTLFAGPLNISASNNPYKRKCEAYAKSAIKMTKSLPDDYPEFRFAQVRERSERFSEMAVSLWPIP